MWQSPTSPGAGTPDGAPLPPGATYPPPWGSPAAPPWVQGPVQGPGPWSPPPGAWWPPAPGPTPRQPRSRKVVIAIVAACVLAVVVLGAAIAGAVTVGRAAAQGMTSSVKTAAPVAATGLGDDAGLNGYAARCHDGDMQACDDLFDESDPMSRYEQYGMTCGGRVKPFDVDYCTDLD